MVPARGCVLRLSLRRRSWRSDDDAERFQGEQVVYTWVDASGAPRTIGRDISRAIMDPHRD